MKKIKIGIICPSEIAYRRFMPALTQLSDKYEFVGVAIADEKEWNGIIDNKTKQNEIKKANQFIKDYGGQLFKSYSSLITSNQVEAIYLPLPPALHFQWAQYALNNNKHVFLEKPSTTHLKDTQKLIELSKLKKLVIHENYMFQYHKQIDIIKKLIKNKEIGEIRLIRSNFGYPKRSKNDFRYNKELGGGSLLDCGGYPIKLMTLILGKNIQVDSSKLFYNEQDIDLYGSAQLSSKNQVAQISFGMDNSYKCDIEIWGSLGTITSSRIFTAPNGFETDILISTNTKQECIHVDGDDSFRKSLVKFYECIINTKQREKEYCEILLQSKLVELIKEKSKYESN